MTDIKKNMHFLQITHGWRLDHKVYFSEKLQMHYIHCQDLWVFEDGVKYKDQDLKAMGGDCPKKIVEFIHAGRKVFGWELKILPSHTQN